MISFANSAMLPKLKLLWKECFFEDTNDEIEFYYNNCFRPERALVYLEDGEPVAMIHILLAELMQGGTYHPIAYAHAVATTQKQRGKGLSTKLLNFAKKWLTKSGVEAIVLVPADERLYGFYGKRGYTAAFVVKTVELEVTAQAQNKVASSAILPEEYKTLRDAFFARDGYVSWGIELISYMIAENTINGGVTVKITIDNKEYAVFGIAKGDILNIKETTLADEHMHTALSYLALQMGCKKIVATLPANSTLEGKIINCGMIDTPTQHTSGYINLT